MSQQRINPADTTKSQAQVLKDTLSRMAFSGQLRPPGHMKTMEEAAKSQDQATRETRDLKDGTLEGLQPKGMYTGTVPAATVANRRAANKAARKQRKANARKGRK